MIRKKNITDITKQLNNLLVTEAEGRVFTHITQTEIIALTEAINLLLEEKQK